MYTTYIVKRTQIYLEEAQGERLAKRAAAEGATRSEVIRRAIDSYLESPPNDVQRVTRFREAVREAAGIAPYLPEGSIYVEALRGGDLRRQRELERRWRG